MKTGSEIQCESTHAAMGLAWLLTTDGHWIAPLNTRHHTDLLTGSRRAWKSMV